MSGSDNGVLKTEITEGHQTRIIYETGSGVVFHITPINLPTLRAIQLKAQTLYPYPDKANYQQPEANAFSDNQMTPVADNPAYIQACMAVDRERSQWTDRAIFDYAVTCPKYPTRHELVNAFAPQLASLRQVAELPDDDYEAILLHLVLSWNQVGLDTDKQLRPASSDYSRIIQLAIQTVALTPAEVTAGVRFFRPKVQ